MECSINNPAVSLLMKHLVIGQRWKASNFSAFHWSPHSSLVSIGQNFVTTRVVHSPKRTETGLITESDQSGPNHQLLQLCTARTAWSDSDQAVRSVHGCTSWFIFIFNRVSDVCCDGRTAIKHHLSTALLLLLLTLCYCFTSMVNSCGHVGTISWPNHTFPCLLSG